MKHRISRIFSANGKVHTSDLKPLPRRSQRITQRRSPKWWSPTIKLLACAAVIAPTLLNARPITMSLIEKNSVAAQLNIAFQGGVLHWRNIGTMFNPSSATYDEGAQAPYIWSADSRVFYGLNNIMDKGSDE